MDTIREKKEGQIRGSWFENILESKQHRRLEEDILCLVVLPNDLQVRGSQSEEFLFNPSVSNQLHCNVLNEYYFAFVNPSTIQLSLKM